MFHRSLLALSLTLLIGSSAYADTIFITPALEPPNDGFTRCRVLNAHTTQTIQFVSQIFDFNGNVLFNSAGTIESLAPLTISVGASNSPAARYCIVTLVSGPKTKVRVTISIEDSNGTIVAALEGHP
jgi:hypothetical protein